MTERFRAKLLKKSERASICTGSRSLSFFSYSVGSDLSEVEDQVGRSSAGAPMFCGHAIMFSPNS